MSEIFNSEANFEGELTSDGAAEPFSVEAFFGINSVVIFESRMISNSEVVMEYRRLVKSNFT